MPCDQNLLVSRSTVVGYLDIPEDALLAFLIPPWVVDSTIN